MKTFILQDIPFQYRVDLRETHNMRIEKCSYCDEDLVNGFRILTDCFIGFSEYLNRVAIVYECPKCGEVQYHHASSTLITLFLQHFSKQGE